MRCRIPTRVAPTPKGRRSGGRTASRHSGTSCDTTCSHRDAHRVMHAVVTRVFAARPPYVARGVARHRRGRAGGGAVWLRLEAANAVADCKRARNSLPVVGVAM